MGWDEDSSVDGWMGEQALDGGGWEGECWFSDNYLSEETKKN